MNTGSHIGEYIKQKLKQEGRSQSWLADQLGFTRQNINPTIMDKSVLDVERLVQLERVLGRAFFEDYYKANPNVQPSVREVDESTGSETVQTNVLPNTNGFSLSLQIDPENFNPDKTQILSKHLEKMLRDYQAELKNNKL